MLSYSERKTFARNGARAMDKTIADALKAEAGRRATQEAANIAAYRARLAPKPFTEDEYRAAKVVRNSLGWHRVVRVNTKSVTVESGYSWNDRIDRDKILEVRS